MTRLVEITGKPDAMKLVEVFSREKRACCRATRVATSNHTDSSAPHPLQLDMRDESAMRALFAAHKFEAVIHFAGYKAVGESKLDPLLYYSNNMKSSINLLEAMRSAGCKRIVFSSSCTVYGASPAPLTEDSTIGMGITNAYGRTKFQIEEMLRDLHESDPTWDVCILVSRLRFRQWGGCCAMPRSGLWLLLLPPLDAETRGLNPTPPRALSSVYPAALLQSSRCSRERADRRGPAGHPQLPHAVHPAGEPRQ